MGHQLPRIFHAPGPVRGSLGREAVDLAELAGLKLDPWQAWVMEQGCSVNPEVLHWNPYTERNEAKWSPFEVGLMVSRQNGKGDQSLDTPILTTDGWSTMGEIRPGQYVYGSGGEPTRVVAASPVYTDSDCYELWFKDGSSYTVGSGHLWLVHAGRDRAFRVVDTATIAAAGVRKPRTGPKHPRYTWRVSCGAQLQTPDADLPIDPYLFGYWLGDGTSTEARLAVGSEDRAWVMDRIEEAGAQVNRVILAESRGHTSYILGFTMQGTRRLTGFRARCRELGVWGDKGIPEVYLTASVAQRKQLLAGLLDSDGFIGTTGLIEFCSSSPKLAEDFMRLVRSLGIRTSKRVSVTKHKGERKRDRTRFFFSPAFNPFQLPRKAARWRPRETQGRRMDEMGIVGVRRVPTVPTRCIQVAAEDGVYLCGKYFTPTHNSILEARALAGLFLFGERLIIHTAHLFKTSGEAFERVVTLIQNTPELRKEVDRIPRSKGEEGVVLRTGQRLLFATRTKGGGRGLTADCVILDEAMYLDDPQMAALMPTLSARPNPQIWYTGSAGDEDSTQFGAVRARALKGGDPRLFYAEWSIDGCNEFCPKDCTAHDRDDDVASYAKANPGLGIRISTEYIEDERRSLDREYFRRERLGVGTWPTHRDSGWGVISSAAWAACADQTSQIEGKFAIGVDTSPDRSFTCLAVAGLNGAGLTHVEVTGDGESYDHRPGTAWVVDSVLRIWRSQKPLCVVIDKASQAGSFVDPLEAAGVKVVCPTSREYAHACGELYSSAVPQRGESISLAHLGQAPLTSAVAAAVQRPLADTWAWSRSQSSEDITALCAATLAAWGFKKLANEAPSVAPWAAWAPR